MRRWLEARKARTLPVAHEVLVRLRPAPDAAVSEWRNFHLRASAVYRHVAEVDHGHQSEALYWAQRETAKADDLAARPTTSSTAAAAGRRRKTRRGNTDERTPGPVTLEAAHDALREVEPGKDAPVEAWAAYHRHAMDVYAKVSEVDRAHHHEALAYAGRARMTAAGLAQQLDDGENKARSSTPIAPDRRD